MTRKELKEKGFISLKSLGKLIGKEWIRTSCFPKEILLNGISFGNAMYYPEETINKIKEYLNLSKSQKYAKTCLDKYGVDNISKLKEIQNKKSSTMTKHFGTSKSFCLPQSKNTILDKYGVDNISKSKEIQKKKEETCLKNYGVKNGFMTKNCQKAIRNKYNVDNVSSLDFVKSKKRKYRNKKYIYDGVYFDSSWELAYYYYLKSNNIDFEYQPDIMFKYIDGNKEHEYWPDFKVMNRIVEIKGNQFFKNGKMYNPYDGSSLESKYKCMLDNNVLVLKEDDINPYLWYAEKALGDLRKFRKLID